MLQIDGYHVGEPLDRSERRVLLAATRRSDGRRAVLKVYARDENRPPEATRAFREFSILRGIDAPGVVRALGLERAGDWTVLTLERADGVPLSELGARSEPELDVEALLQDLGPRRVRPGGGACRADPAQGH